MQLLNKLRGCLLTYGREVRQSPHIRGYSQKIETSVESEKVPVLEKWKRYWQDLLKDYSDVFTETIENGKKSPRKTFLTCSVLGLTAICFKTNPDFMDYRDSLLQHSNELLLVAKPIRNPKTEKFITSIEACCNMGILRRLNFGLFSVLWFDNYGEDLGIYYSNCSYLKPQYLNFHTRIVDIGFFSKWWRLDKIMEDYDVNEEEWTSQNQEST